MSVFSIHSAYNDKMYLQMPVLAVEATGFMETVLDQISTRTPLRDGGKFLGVRLQPREVVFTLHMRTTSRSDMWLLRRELANLMNPLLGAFTIRAYNDDGVHYELRQCHFQDGFAGGIGLSYPLLQQQISLTVLSYDPMFYQLPNLAHVSALPAVITELVFPAAFPIMFDVSSLINEIIEVTVGGNWYTYPTIVFTGPLTYPYVENLTVGEKIGLNYTIPNGVTVTVTTEPENCTVIDSLGNNLFSSLTADSDITTFRLSPEVLCGAAHNYVQVVGVEGALGASSIVLYWANRWVTL